MNSPSQLSPKLERKSVTSSKKNYELLWRTIFVLISIVSAILISKVFIYQTSQHFDSIRKGNFYELFLFGIPFGAFFLICETLIHRHLDPICEQHYINHDKYKNEQARRKRCYTLVKWAFSIIYYAISSLAGYLIIKETTFMPTWLGGHGYCTDLTRYINSFDEASTPMKVYYILQFGKHLARFFQHLFIRAEGNFYQYALHHGLSTFLIFFSYLTNQWIVGIFVLMIHDVSDIVLIMCRAYRDCKKINKPLLTVMDTIGGVTWVFCRIFLLSYCCVYSSFMSANKFTTDPQSFSPFLIEIMYFPGYFMAFMLGALEVLQVFWTYYIFSSIIAVNVSEKIAKHTYD